MSTDRLFDVLEQTVASVLRTETIDAAMGAMTEQVVGRVDIWSSWITVPRRGWSVEVRAASARFWTHFEPGQQIPIDLEDWPPESVAASVSGRPFIHVPSPQPELLMDAMLLREGVRSVLVTPFLDLDGPRAFLSLGAFDEAAVTSRQIPFFEGLARGVEKHVLALLT